MSRNRAVDEPELRLLLACARVLPDDEADAAVRRMLETNINWTAFARMALDQGLAGLVGHALERIAPDMVSDEILDALRVNGDQVRHRNGGLLVEVSRIIESLANGSVDAVALRGPILVDQAYGDPALRVFQDLEFLVHESDAGTALAILRSLGYERNGQLSAAQLDLIRHLDGHETVVKKPLGLRVRIRTRLTPGHMALRIDDAGLWRRAQRLTLHGCKAVAPAPEDALLLLAVHGGEGLWRRIGWACDVAAFIGSHASLDWNGLLDRARAQACLRLLLLAAGLASRYFSAVLPDAVAAAVCQDPMIESELGRVMARWQASPPPGEPTDPILSLDQLRLHQGALPRARYLARRVLMPAPHHVMRIRLPDRLTTVPAYVPIKIAQDLAMLPLLHAARGLRSGAERLQDSLASHKFALAIMPMPAEKRARLKKHQAARAEAEKALAANPKNAAQWHSLGNALAGLKRYEEAIGCYDKALELQPDNRGLWRDCAAAIRAHKKTTTASDFAEQPEVEPDDANSWARLAGYFSAWHRFDEAAAASDRALAIDPRHLIAARIGIRARIAACSWRGREDDKRRISEELRAGRDIITPFNHRMISDSDAENLLAARLWTRGLPRPSPFWRGEKYRHDRIRIAYLSAQLHEHAMTTTMAGVFEQHDKTRFETIAISYGPDSAGKMRRRIEAAFDRFIDVRTASDTDVAKMMREMEIDIALELSGHSGSGRIGILAHRPVPVQVNCIIYPGTMGAPCFDYIIADRVVIPEENRIHYSENVVYLPHAYMPNDRTLLIAPDTPSRAEAGLPQTGFVFACQNGEHKFSPEVFEVWMSLLRDVEGSVLWLRSPEPQAIGNLRREAKARGVAPERLIFAPGMAQPAHLARLRLADLFLDTLPCNAHSSACDALWAGLPVLTCLGNAFPGRVAASFLYAVGLPELVTSSLADYEALALALARDPSRLAAIKAKLMRNRLTTPLFDTARYTRDLETAFTMMWERQQRGEPPASFSVPTSEDDTPFGDGTRDVGAQRLASSRLT